LPVNITRHRFGSIRTSEYPPEDVPGTAAWYGVGVAQAVSTPAKARAMTSAADFLLICCLDVPRLSLERSYFEQHLAAIVVAPESNL
jgi:hypothetical protein